MIRRYILVDFAFWCLSITLNIRNIYIHCTYRPTYNITTPHYPSGNRTAILLSGQLRAGNLTWSQVKYFKQKNWFGGDDPVTPIRTILEWLIVPYALYGGVDMFIYIQVDRKQMNSNYSKYINFPCARQT
jgi:hypothetical protein